MCVCIAQLPLVFIPAVSLAVGLPVPASLLIPSFESCLFSVSAELEQIMEVLVGCKSLLWSFLAA